MVILHLIMAKERIWRGIEAVEEEEFVRLSGTYQMPLREASLTNLVCSQVLQPVSLG